MSAAPAPLGRSSDSLRRLSFLAVTALLGACLTAVVTASAIGSPPRAPPPFRRLRPPGPPCSATISPGRRPPSSANWFYDIGTGYGTGEIEQTTSSTANSYLDGSGNLVLKAIKNGSTWTSARLESTRDDFQAARRQDGDDGLDQAAESGERPGLLAKRSGHWARRCVRAAAGPPRARST